MGVDILTKDVEFRVSEIATLSIWDIGGQRRFDFIRSTFYKGAAGVIFIFDLTRVETFTEIRNWFTEIIHFTGYRPFLLIGNNANLLKQDENELLKKEARGFAKNEGGFYIETSPNDIDIVEDAICILTRRITDLRVRN